jgi:hypothetical protein
VDDALTEVLRRGAKELLQQAVEVEVAEAIAQFAELKDEQGRAGGAQWLFAGAKYPDRDW